MSENVSVTQVQESGGGARLRGEARRRRWSLRFLKMCCATGIPEPDLGGLPAAPGCHGHHSLYVQPEATQSASHTGVAVVYRPPQLNQRLAPGESRPRFWINPGPGGVEPAVVSVAWCELCQPAHVPTSAYRCSKLMAESPLNGGLEGRMDGMMDGDFGGLIDDVMMSGDNNIVVKTYPAFLKPYINKIVRLKLNYTDAKTQAMIGAHNHLRHDGDSQHMQETSHLVRTVHSLRLQLRYSSSVRGLPEMVVDENHGGSKRFRKVRYRHMPVRWIDVDHRFPRIVAVGDAFHLSLSPPCPHLQPEDFPDGNGEVPEVVGEYRRTLDTQADMQLTYSVRLYQWYNQTTPSDCSSDASAQNMEGVCF